MAKIENFALTRGNKDRIIIFLLLAVGIGVRLINFGSIPSGFNQDEAYAAYESYSLLNYGVDSFGYHNPCYFIAWGSGMNVLESYLAIPFFWLFGCSELVFRLPELIISLLSLVVFYLTLREIFSEKTAMLGLFLLVISPWHIMISRWGLESNMAPHFLLFGFYFFIKGIKNSRYWLLSALMYGISLYAYSITWAVVPLMLLASGIYVVAVKKKVSLKHVISSVAILFVLALPLILFMLVNNNIIPEISTPFISVPKLVEMRSGELSLGNMASGAAFLDLFSVTILQNDGLIWNATKFGLFYKISIPFLIVGIIGLIVMAYRKSRSKNFSYEALILLCTLCCTVVCLMISDLNINRANSLHYFNLMIIVAGISMLSGISKKRWMTIIKALALGVYIVCFIMFSCYYFGDYGEDAFDNGISDAVEYTKENGYESVYVNMDISFAQILFADKTPHDVWSETVVYNNYPSSFMTVRSFANYIFVVSKPKIEINEAFITKIEDVGLFEGRNYIIKVFDDYAVVHQ